VAFVQYDLVITPAKISDVAWPRKPALLQVVAPSFQKNALLRSQVEAYAPGHEVCRRSYWIS
jgi:hypothetical protein